jgi:hypothetical protein
MPATIPEHSFAVKIPHPLPKPIVAVHNAPPSQRRPARTDAKQA